jgi:hypothetical protein
LDRRMPNDAIKKSRKAAWDMAPVLCKCLISRNKIRLDGKRE